MFPIENIKKDTFDSPSALTFVFKDGSTRKAIVLPSAAIGLGVYQPGWRWSLHAGSITGKPAERHIAYILSGSMCIQSQTGEQQIIRSGEAFEVGPRHDAWVIGNQPCEALDFISLTKNADQ